MKKNKINFISFIFTVSTLSVAVGEIFDCKIHPSNFKPGQFIEININNTLRNNQGLFIRIKTNNVYFTEQEITNVIDNIYTTKFLVPEFCTSIDLAFRDRDQIFFKKNNKIQKWSFMTTTPEPIKISDTKNDRINPSSVMMQGFYWDCPEEWYHTMQKAAHHLRYIYKGYGIDRIWFPPPQKSDFGVNSMGYDPYDYYDLGTYNQKGTVSTRFGTNKQLQRTIKTYQTLGIKCMADLVLNHRVGGHLEKHKNDKSKMTNTNFENVKSKKCLWNYNEFYPLMNQFNDLGRFNDYPDISHLNASIKGTAGYDLIQWANWLKLPRNAGFDGGWRFDYVKGINASYIHTFRKKTNNSYGILECWDSLENIEKYSKFSGHTHAFDFPLFYAMSSVFNDKHSIKALIDPNINLATKNPNIAVTFVANHDTDKDHHVPSIRNNIMLAYAFILTYQGYPCVFWHDYFNKKLYNFGGQDGNGIAPLIWIRGNLGGKNMRTHVLDSSDAHLAYESTNKASDHAGFISLINNSNYEKKVNLVSKNEHFFSENLISYAWYSYDIDHNKKITDLYCDNTGKFSCTIPPNGYLVLSKEGLE